MPVFHDSAQLYRVLGAFFERVMGRPELEDAFVAGHFVLRFRYREPEGQVTIDLRRKPVRWEFGETSLAPDLEMIQSADVAHQFWLGRLNVPAALATRKVVARGPVAKALKLLPAAKPTFPLYEATLRDLGLSALVPDRARQPEGLFDRARSLLGRRDSARGPSPQVESFALPMALLDEGAAEPSLPSFRREAAPPAEERALRVEMLRRMMLVRAFEEKLAEANARGELPTEAIHLCVGQEATAVGACFALAVDDFMATTHRGHGHMLAKGADLDGMMAEILGRATGLCGGKGGSMHVTEAAVGAIGANGIVGASALLAAGAAHSARLRGSGQVALAFFGDGATNQGMFHEAMNFAAVLALPAVFVVENNLYGEFTPLAQHTRVVRLAERAAAYGVPAESVDGNDVWAVYQVVRRAVERARRGEGPSFVEARTYRWRGHMEGEPTGYRTDEELRAWKERCPIAGFRTALATSGEVPAPAADDLEREAHRRVEAAYQRARAAPEPELSALTADVFAPDRARLWRRAAGPAAGHREVSYSQAVQEALAAALARDERVYLLGEDVAAGGYFAVTAGLVDRFGRERIIDTPISEYAIVGSAVGAAMTGMRPVAEILFSDFLTTCMDPLVNHAAKLRYMAGGQYAVPLVVRTPGGAGLGMAAQHSQSLEALLTGIPGLVVVAPATPYDAKGLLTAAIRSNNPVVFFENKLLYVVTGPVPEEDYLVPLGTAEVKRSGTDVTVATVGAALGKALEAAAILSGEGVEIEVIDLRTLAPLDLPTVVESVRKTGRLVTVEDGALGHGFGAEVLARVVESAFASLRAPPRRVAGLDVPIPYNSRLENAALPDAARVAEAVRRALKER